MSDIKQRPGVVRILKACKTKQDVFDVLGSDVNLTALGWTEKSSTVHGHKILKFLVEDISDNQFHIWNAFIADSEVMSRNGKYIFIDDYGISSGYSYSVKDLPDFIQQKMRNPRKSREGEVFVTAILQGVCHYQPDYEEDSWTEQTYFKGFSFENLLKGEYEGLNRFLKYFSERGGVVGCLFTKSGQYQNIESHPDTVFRTEDEDIPPYFIQRLQSFKTGYSPIRGEINLNLIEI